MLLQSRTHNFFCLPRAAFHIFHFQTCVCLREKNSAKKKTKGFFHLFIRKKWRKKTLLLMIISRQTIALSHSLTLSGLLDHSRIYFCRFVLFYFIFYNSFSLFFSFKNRCLFAVRFINETCHLKFLSVHQVIKVDGYYYRIFGLASRILGNLADRIFSRNTYVIILKLWKIL